MNTKTISFGPNKYLTVNFTDRIISTHYDDRHIAYGTRDVTYDNVQEARHQGYQDDSEETLVWVSLLDHELLHNILPPFLLDNESYVLQHESGKQLCRYALRLHEEALVISFQYWMNTGQKDPVLSQYSDERLKLLQTQLVRLKTNFN